MTYLPGESYYAQFTTQSPMTGAAQDADELPVATATQNGADDAEFVLTVTNIDTGRYSITGTVPESYVQGDRVQVSVAATVAGVSGKGVVDSFAVGPTPIVLDWLLRSRIFPALSISATGCNPNIGGMYHPAGFYDGNVYWASVGDVYLVRWNDASERWEITDASGVLKFYRAAELASSFSPRSPSTGNPVVSYDWTWSALPLPVIGADTEPLVNKAIGALSAAALAAAPTGVTLNLSSGTVGELPECEIECYEAAAFGLNPTIVLTALNSQTGKTHKFVVWDRTRSTVQWSFTGNTKIVVSGATGKTLTLIDPATRPATPGAFAWELWNTTDHELLGHGPLLVKNTGGEGS